MQRPYKNPSTQSFNLLSLFFKSIIQVLNPHMQLLDAEQHSAEDVTKK